MSIANIFRACYFWIGKTISGKVKRTNKMTFEFDSLNPNERLRELILYIVKKHHGNRSFGALKLYKVLFFSDFRFFAAHGEPITGAAYKKDEFGPVPANIFALLEQMKTAGELEQKKHQFGQTKRSVFTAMREADLKNFSREQIAEVDRAIHEVGYMTSDAVSEMSHKRAWRIARMEELIPYQFALLSDEPISNDEINRTKELAAQYGWEN